MALRSFSIKSKITTLVALTGLLAALLIAFFSPYQAVEVGSAVLENQTTFVARLLSENLALGMQAMVFDDGESLRETLELLRAKEDEKHHAISDVWVYDDNLEFVAGLGDSESAPGLDSASSEFAVTHSNSTLNVSAPLADSDGEILGYVMIEFSKGFLQAKADESTRFAVAIAVGIILLVGLAGYFFGRRIGRPLAKIADAADLLATGCIDCEMEVRSRDEIGRLASSFRDLIAYIRAMAEAAERIASKDLSQAVKARSDDDVLGKSFEKMTGNLRAVVEHLNTTADELVNTADEIAGNSEQASTGARTQSERVEGVSTAIGQMNNAIMESARYAEEVAQTSTKASGIASSGGETVQETIDGMQRIVTVVQGSADSIRELAGSVTRISEVTDVIDEIADQTNLLALNAAIEAARAGEAGRGFAVVADEVRKLAEKTAKATREITGMVSGIQNQAESSVEAMDSGVSEVTAGSELAQKAGASLTEILSINEQVQEMVQNIASSATEQSASAEEISRSINDVTQVTRATSEGATRSAETATRLAEHAERLQGIVAEFEY
jgi:methyl-accepting chemotaxis protein